MGKDNRDNALRIRPVYALLAAIVLGILAAGAVPLPAVSLLGAMGLLLIAALLLGRRAASVLPLAAVFVLLGMLRAEQAASIAADDISRYATARPVRVLGTVASAVRATPGRAGQGETYAFTFQARAPVSGLARALLIGAETPPRTGDLLWLNGSILEPEAATNPDGFDERAYLARRGIHAILLVKRASNVRWAGRVPLPLLEAIGEGLRDRAERMARTHLAPEDAALILGMLGAERGALSADMEDAFTRTGTLHLLSVSGLHVAVIAGLTLWALRLLTLPRKAICVLTLAAVWLFAFAAGGADMAEGIHAPTLRAALCSTIFLAAPLFRRTAEPRHSLAVAALVLLLLDPLALYEPGTRLTFATVGALLFWIPPLERLFAPWEPGLPRPRRLARAVLLGLMGGIVAQVGSWPLSAYHFHVFSAVAPLANLVLAPLADTLLTLGLILAALPFLPLWSLLGVGVHLLRVTALSFGAPEWAAWSVAAPPGAFVLIYYSLLFGAAVFVRKRVLAAKRLFAPGVTGPFL